ncbi:MAG: peptide chain release factor aRF-1 [Candidatus Aenigmarchaeota archaeon]|nr:peptide chain release factor aRF-1 [Candidatus Aenigmarchaeota archaeon]
MVQDTKDIQELIGELEKIRGRHTELVTVYIPSGVNIAKVVEQIRSEQSTAQNIKSKAVRKNVMAALDKVLQELRFYKETPPNGLAIFCGNVSEHEGGADIELWAVEPPEPVKTRLYRCDQMFIMDPLKEMTREKEIYGLILVDKSDAAIGLLLGKRVEMLKYMDSIVPGKTKKGGWSQARYARIREGLLNDFLKKVGDTATQLFSEQKDMVGVIIGGPGPIKEEFAEGEFMHYMLKKKLIGIVNTSYTGEYGLKEMVDRAEDLLAEAAVMREKKILDRFFEEFAKDTGRAIYGVNEVLHALTAGSLEMILVSEKFDYVKARFACQCGHEEDKIIQKGKLVEHKCDKCGSTMALKEERLIRDEIIRMAKDFGTAVELISVHTPRGEQLKELGGLAGMLRYKTQQL